MASVASATKKAGLVFIPAAGQGHLVSMVEFAKRLVDRDDRFSITVLLMKPPFAPNILNPYIQSLVVSVDTRIQFIHLPHVEFPSLSPDQILKSSPEKYVSDFIENYKPHVKDTILSSHFNSNSVQLSGLVLDLFCTSMIDVANQLGVPSYLFFTSSAAFLGLMLYLPTHHHQISTEFTETDPESIIPSYANPVPASVLPSVVFNKEGGYTSFLSHASKFRETKGIIVNTFSELEPHAIKSFLDDHQMPPVYTVGPLLDLKGQKREVSDRDKIMRWLDDQPQSSVVFLCFGSMGSFGAPQLKETAIGLERSGKRFLWSIRQHPLPNDHDIFPDGFLERTEGIRGMVCGWAPQVEVLAHRSIGGFVSHCGWNSSLESLWYGVPIVTWPMYAEQQAIAFEMVRELGLAVEMKLDYRSGCGSGGGGGGDDDAVVVVVTADEIERAVRCVMEVDCPVREKVKEMGEKSRKAVMEGGSSFTSFGRLITDMLETTNEQLS